MNTRSKSNLEESSGQSKSRKRKSKDSTENKKNEKIIKTSEKKNKYSTNHIIKKHQSEIQEKKDEFIADRKNEIQIDEFIKNIEKQRYETAESIESFHFNKKRVKILSKLKDVPEKANGILYWMYRDQRVQDNWALLYAQRLAFKLKLPLHICFCLGDHILERTSRHMDFMLTGLEEVSIECNTLNIGFHILNGIPDKEISNFVLKKDFGALVVDFSPLREPLNWLDSITQILPPEIPIVQVDSHNIVPCWVASDKLEFGAYTIRPKITKLLSEYLTEFPPLIKHVHKRIIKSEKIDWNVLKSSLNSDTTVKPVKWAHPGTYAGLKQLAKFLHTTIHDYADKRNNPNYCATSRLSPWLHFGSISAQRCALEAQVLKAKYNESITSFLEEIIIRRELSDNFCWYNKNDYDKFQGAHKWAQTTLNEHRQDKRQWTYTLEDLQSANTHETLWNAAQKQLAREGHLHGFLRMYWAKKILEWSVSPEEALKNAIWLNDYYSLDGSDPNGFVGCMWSICGVHDRAWKERPIFGKIRYMNLAGCKNKFKIDEFIKRYQ